MMTTTSSTPFVIEVYSPDMPFCAASAIRTTTSRSVTPVAPLSRRWITRRRVNRTRYMTLPRRMISSGETCGMNNSRQTIAGRYPRRTASRPQASGSEFARGVQARVGGLLEEVGEELQLLFVVTGAELVHGRVHAGEQDVHLAAAFGQRPHRDGAPVGRVAFPADPAGPFQPV